MTEGACECTLVGVSWGSSCLAGCLDMIAVEGRFTFTAERPQLSCAAFFMAEPNEVISVDYDGVDIDCSGGDFITVKPQRAQIKKNIWSLGENSVVFPSLNFKLVQGFFWSFSNKINWNNVRSCYRWWQSEVVFNNLNWSRWTSKRTNTCWLFSKLNLTSDNHI